MINAWRSVSVAIGLFVFASAAVATESDVRNACMNDAKKFCGSVVDQTDARRACMTKNQSKLSRRCKIAIRKDTLEHAGPRPR